MMSNCPYCDSEWAYHGLDALECVNPQCSAFDREHMVSMFRDFWRKRAVLALTKPDDISSVKLPLGWYWDHSRHDTIVCWHSRNDGRNQVININF